MNFHCNLKILKNSKVTDFAPGDTVKVNVKIKEGTKERKSKNTE